MQNSHDIRPNSEASSDRPFVTRPRARSNDFVKPSVHSVGIHLVHRGSSSSSNNSSSSLVVVVVVVTSSTVVVCLPSARP